MLSNVISCSHVGVEGYIVRVEVDISNGLPTFGIVGLGDTAISESKERVRSAIKNSGFNLIPKRLIVNLSPADIEKRGASFDLSISIGILSAYNLMSKDRLKDYMLLGELSLGGEIQKTKGIINSVITAKQNNLKGIILPYENYEEASIISGLEIIPVKNLKEVVEFLNGEKKINIENRKKEIIEKKYNFDLSEVKGQAKAKRAMELAAAGGHNIFLNGSPGSGKSMLAKRMVTILPRMTEEEIIESTKIYSIAGLLSKDLPVISQRPFRSPHHTASDVSLIGGGRFPKPGEITLAHNGILFLDEVSEFSKKVLEVLRQPLEDRVVTVSRASHSVEFPANFQFIAASNPCPCGYLYEDNNSSKSCTCTPYQVKNYQKKISGPILDRMDMYLEIRRLSEDELFRFEEGESSEKIRERVEVARGIQRKRYKSSKTNANMTPKEIKKYCKLDSDTEILLKAAAKNLNLSGRGFDKILKTARTVADINLSEKVNKIHLIEAIGFRNN